MKDEEQIKLVSDNLLCPNGEKGEVIKVLEKLGFYNRESLSY